MTTFVEGAKAGPGDGGSGGLLLPLLPSLLVGVQGSDQLERRGVRKVAIERDLSRTLVIDIHLKFN